MSIVLKNFFSHFLQFYHFTQKHMFKFIYVNQVIHMVILVDNVDKFVHNLIIGGFADFCHVENFLESFSLIHHGSTSFVHIARTTFSGLILPVSARTCLMLPILSDFISSLSFCSFLWCFSCVRSWHQHCFLLMWNTKTTCGFFSFELFSPHNLSDSRRQIVWLLLCTKKRALFSAPDILTILI